MAETGIRRPDNGGAFCEKCGADVTADGSVRLLSYLDGRDFFENQFECVKCGAILTQRYYRIGEDATLWTDGYAENDYCSYGERKDGKQND